MLCLLQIRRSCGFTELEEIFPQLVWGYVFEGCFGELVEVDQELEEVELDVFFCLSVEMDQTDFFDGIVVEESGESFEHSFDVFVVEYPFDYFFSFEVGHEILYLLDVFVFLRNCGLWEIVFAQKKHAEKGEGFDAERIKGAFVYDAQENSD